MISDGKNLMLNSREEYRLWLILKDISENRFQYFGDSEPDQILLKWIDRMYDSVDTARKNPFTTIEM